VLPGTGQIGAGANIRIRGMGTLSLSSQPLVYVDGVRVNNATGSGLSVQAFGSGVVSRLNDFSPSEIESIEVLKGPAAATLYGTEAARGVINIITKKGSAGGTKFSFQAQGGSNWFQNAEGRIATNYCVQPTPDQCLNSNAVAGPLLGLNVVKQEDARGTPIFRDGQLRNYSGNVSGGNQILRFFASGEIGSSEGAERTNSRNQRSVRTNLNITPNTLAGKIKAEVSTNTVIIVLTVHDVSFVAHPEWFSWREGVRRRVLTKASAKRAARVLTQSDFTKREAVRYLGLDQSRVDVIYLGTTTLRTQATREPLVLYVGSLFNRRHIPELIEGFSQLAATHPAS